MKKHHEYCEIVSPYRFINGQSMHKNVRDIIMQDQERTYILFGTKEDGTLNFLRNENGTVCYFYTPLDAANYLSKDGWYLAKTFSTSFDNKSFEHWIMAREVED